MELSMRSFLFLLLFALPVVADDWPQWMGPDLTGVSAESGWSTKWPADGLQPAWTKDVGTGFSSVSVAGGRIFTMGHSDGKETVWCLDEASGDEIWACSYEAKLNANLYEGGPGATPTVDGDRVYSLSIDGRLLCLNVANGDRVWEVDLKAEFGVRLHEWGFNSSPLIVGDRLYVQGGRIACFDKANGDVVWKSARHNAGYGSVRTFPWNGVELLASLDCDGLRISLASDGSEFAFAAWKSPFRTNSTTPIIVGDRIYISTGYNIGCGLFQLKASGEGGALEEIYTSKRMRNHFNNSILFEGHLYGVDGNSNLGRVVTLTCMNFETGEVVWKERGLGCGSLMIADGKLVVLSEKGDLVIANASPDGFEEVARTKFLSGRCWTVPVLVNGRVFGRNAAGKLVCAKL